MGSSSLRSYLYFVPVAISFCASAPALATKAKVQSLQGAEFLIDSQRVFQNPSQIHQLGNYFTLEMGTSGAASSPKAEGGLFKPVSDAKGGIYLGHVSAEQTAFRSAGGFLTEENPVEAFYGKGNWATSLGFSNSNKKTTDEKQQTVLARFGMTNNDWDAWANAELISKADKAQDSYQGAPVLRIGGSYSLGDYFFSGKIRSGTIKSEIAGTTTKTSLTGAELFALDRSIKKENTSLYYGPSLQWSETKVGSKKVTRLAAPLYAGIEHAYFDWMDLRGSISQNIGLIGSTKDGTQASPADKEDTIPDDTTVAAGVGFKKDSLTIDATFSGATTGALNGNDILANLGMTYTF